MREPVTWEEWWNERDPETGRSLADMYASGDIDDHRTWRQITMEAFEAGFAACRGFDEETKT